MINCVRTPRLEFELPDGLVVAATTSPNDPLLDEFFKSYDRAFILPSEKEEWNGFVECLKLNDGDEYSGLATMWGPYREWVLLARSRDADHPVLGGANLICYPLRTAGNSILLSTHLNYLFIDPEQRGRGYFRRMIGACQELVRRSFVPAPAAGVLQVVMFLEQNDPLKMLPDEYERDSAHSGVDQVDRVRIWRRVGARIVDFPYVQPALSGEQLPDRGLMLSVIGINGLTLDGCLLNQHLERFFAISVLKGRDPRSDLTAREQLVLSEDACRANRPFSILDPQSWLETLGGGPPYDLRDEFETGSLLTCLRAPREQ